MRSRTVRRIADVRMLRSHQFAEDAGPLAHPVRPEIYREINNFYTATVYEKGAEVVRMLKTLLGPERFRAGMDLYFARHDGRAATVEDFIACFADAASVDLRQFMLWYSQAGTPELVVTTRHDPHAHTFSLEIAQVVPPTPGQPIKTPMVVPLAFGLVGPDGCDLPLVLSDGRTLADGVLTLTKAAERFVFTGVAARPALSLNRGFSAPVKVSSDLSDDELRFLAARDGDSFNRWQAVQTLASALLLDNVGAVRAGRPLREDSGLLDALAAILADTRLEPAFVALALSMPSEGDIARDLMRDVDPDAIFLARQALRYAIGVALGPSLLSTYRDLHDGGPVQSRRGRAPGAGR